MAKKKSDILPENILSLHNSGIKNIPEEVFKHTRLEKLDLSYNNISEIDDRIGSLNYLKHLDLSNNKLQFLPESISNLKKLEVLILSNNQLEVFPKIITKLHNLKTLKIKGNKIKELPEEIGTLRLLKQLDLGFNPLKKLPQALSVLTKLTELSCTSNHFSEFPSVLLEMEQLKHPEKLDLGFRLKLPLHRLRQLFKVLKHLKKQKASSEVKAAAFNIYMHNRYEGDPIFITPLLQINYVEFSQAIRNYLIEQYSSKIKEKSCIAILGKTDWVETEMHAQDVEISTEITSKTTHLIVGRQVTKQQIATIPKGLSYISEKMLLTCLNPKLPAEWLTEHRGKLTELLLSEQNENISLALQISRDNELLDSLLTELLIAYTYINTGNKTLRDEIKEIFYTRIPDFEKIILPNSSFSFFTSKKSENMIMQGIKNITHQTKCWDGMKIAHYLYKKHGAGYHYIMEYSTVLQEQKWLKQFAEGNEIRFSELKKLKQLPKSIILFNGIKTLNLRGCSFRRFPDTDILNRMPELERIDLQDNPISHIPSGLYSQVSKYKILLTK